MLLKLSIIIYSSILTVLLQNIVPCNSMSLIIMCPAFSAELLLYHCLTDELSSFEYLYGVGYAVTPLLRPAVLLISEPPLLCWRRQRHPCTAHSIIGCYHPRREGGIGERVMPVVFWMICTFIVTADSLSCHFTKRFGRLYSWITC